MSFNRNIYKLSVASFIHQIKNIQHAYFKVVKTRQIKLSRLRNRNQETVTSYVVMLQDNKPLKLHQLCIAFSQFNILKQARFYREIC